MPAGRPTKYKPEYCKRAVECLAKGHSVLALAGELDVSPSTVQLWEDKHHEFSVAIKRGRAKAVLFWEQRLVTIAEKNDGNVTAAIFGLKNRASAEWRDKTEVDTNVNLLDNSLLDKINAQPRAPTKP